MAKTVQPWSQPIDPKELKGRRLGRVLTKLKKITRDQVHEALQLQKTRKQPLGELLVSLGYIDETDVMEARAGQAGMRMVNLDEIVGQGQATSLLITVTNTLSGEPIDVSEPSDSDADGKSDSDSTHTLIVTYSDKNQVIRDVYWTKTFVGGNDGDGLLEAGEKVELTVSLGGLSNSFPVIGDTKWDIELRPEDGGTVVVERSMPDVIDTVMNLN